MIQIFKEGPRRCFRPQAAQSLKPPLTSLISHGKNTIFLFEWFSSFFELYVFWSWRVVFQNAYILQNEECSHETLISCYSFMLQLMVKDTEDGWNFQIQHTQITQNLIWYLWHHYKFFFVGPVKAVEMDHRQYV